MTPDLNISLKPFHFFASEEKSNFFTRIQNENQVEEAVHWCHENKYPFLIIGSGSNILFTKNGKCLCNSFIKFFINACKSNK